MNYFEATFMQETETKKSALDVLILFGWESSNGVKIAGPLSVDPAITCFVDEVITKTFFPNSEELQSWVVFSSSSRIFFN